MARGGGWKPTNRARNPKRGGERNNLPRSLGATLECVRRELGLDQAGMLQRLKETESPFPLPRARSEEMTNPGQVVQQWETARTNPCFGYLHRYGICSRTLPGVLHVASLIYAHLRDATEPSVRQAELAKARAIVDALAGLVDTFEQTIDRYEESGIAAGLRGDPADGTVRERHLEIIGGLLDGYRVKRSPPQKSRRRAAQA